MRAEKQVEQMAMSLRSQKPLTADRLSVSSLDDEEELACDISKRVLDCVATINNVAAKSSNLKGTFQKALKDASSSIKDLLEVLNRRSSSEETRRLQAANKRLREEMADLRVEMAELRRDMTTTRTSVSLPAERSSPERALTAGPLRREPQRMEHLEQAILRQVGGMLNARLDALEDRLLPERRIRPPLAADRRSAAARGASVAPESLDQAGPSGAGASAAAPLAARSTASTRKGASKGKVGVPQGKSGGQPAHGLQNLQPLLTAPAVEGWKTVTRRGRKKRSGVPTPASQQRPSQTQTGLGQPQTNAATHRRSAKTAPVVPKLRAPRSSAVVLTIQPRGAEKGMSYANALAEARQSLELSQFGIPSVHFRRAATGGRLLEVPGAASGDKADSLAARLREIFSPEDVRVSRPIKCVDLRVSGLDDSVTKEEVAAAIAGVGDCSEELIKASDIRRNPAGIGTAFVRCPVTAAKKVVDKGRILIGWVSAQIKLLSPRPQQCFRCLEVGHVREQCRGETDRSNLCYRCGQLGHKAKECSGGPHCAICAAANKPAEHRIGSRACALPPKKNGRKVAAEARTQSQPSVPPSRDEVSPMDASG